MRNPLSRVIAVAAVTAIASGPISVLAESTGDNTALNSPPPASNSADTIFAVPKVSSPSNQLLPWAVTARAIAPNQISATIAGESGANTLALPGQILRTGINLNATTISPNSQQLADLLKLTPVLQRIETLRAHVDDSLTLENVAARQQLMAAIQEAQVLIQEADLAIDFTVAEINAEQQVYNELLSTWQAHANKQVQVSNWASYYSNGALWAVAEALDIPTWKRPKYAIPSGTLGIIAGLVPSAFSLYAMHAANGRKHSGEGVANMLAKIFNLTCDPEVEYPQQVWAFLNAVPPSDKKNRRDQLIDRWVSDANIPAFTDRSSKAQIEALAGTTTDKKVLTISLMQTRLVMLSQLAAEIQKMKRMLYELSMVVHGEKQV
ncbi:MAG TPA: hypothetical protein V6D22_01985 [Candidatus Obscuribacterales bacterium]